MTVFVAAGSNSVATVIINAGAGIGYTLAWTEELTEKFLAQGCEVKIILANSGAQLLDAARTALAQGVKTIVAGGGDGTINAVASIITGSQAALGVLPLGTLNHFAKDLRIPLELDKAIHNIAAGHIVAIDIGDVNGRKFLNNSSLGLYADMARHRKQQRRLGRGKWTAFFWACVATLRRYPFLDVKVTVDGVEQTRHTPFIFIGNNEYTMEGFNIGTRRRMDAGVLSLYAAQRAGRIGLFRLAFSSLLGRLRQERDFEELITHQIRIETHHRRLRVAADGEVSMMETPLQYSILPEALRVIVPGNSGEGRA